MNVEFNPPKRGTAADKIAEFLHKAAGPQDMQTIAEAMMGLGMKRETVSKTLAYMKTNMWVDYHQKKYELTMIVRRFYEMSEPTPAYHGEIVQARSIPEFRPIQPKNQFWNAHRREPIREISFKTAGAPALSFVQPV